MRICWVTNDIWFSRLLRYIFKEPTSHVGAVFSINDIELVLDLNKPYGTLWSKKYWLSKYNIIWQAEVQLPLEKEIELYKSCEEYVILRPYDMNGYYYGMIWGILHKVFGLSYPSYNKWSSGIGSMCQEILTPILQHAIVKETGTVSEKVDFSDMTPDMSMRYLMDLTYNNPAWKWTFNG